MTQKMQKSSTAVAVKRSLIIREHDLCVCFYTVTLTLLVCTVSFYTQPICHKNTPVLHTNVVKIWRVLSFHNYFNVFSTKKIFLSLWFFNSYIDYCPLSEDLRAITGSLYVIDKKKILEMRITSIWIICLRFSKVWLHKHFVS